MRGAPKGTTLVSRADPVRHRDEWLAARRAGIGGSDMPAVMGLSRRRSPLHVYYDKRGELADEYAGEAADWGTEFEPVVARVAARREGVRVRRVGILARTAEPWQMVSLDRVVHGCPDGPCAAEVKTRSAWVAGSWAEGVPDDVLAQVQWGLHVTGWSHQHVWALIGGQRLVRHTVWRDEAVIRLLVAEASALWRHVRDGVPPEVDASGLLLDLLDRLHPSREGTAVVGHSEAYEIREAYRRACEARKAAEDEVDEVKAQAVALLGSAEQAVTDTEMPAWKYRPDYRASTDLARLRAQFPAAYAACVSKKPTRPILRFSKDL